MYKIQFAPVAQKQVHVFIKAYEESFTSLYIDSGISDEDLIIENYIKIGRQFKSAALKKIKFLLEENIVLGRKINSENNYSLIFSERSFLIIIDYTEDTETKTRFIENIIFTKK